MSSASKPGTDSGDESAENGTVPQLISQLKSAFQTIDFDKVQQILMIREEDMKREITHWKKEYELMEKNHRKMELTKLEVEDELNKYKRECCVLRERVTRLGEDQRVQIDRLEEDQRVQITRLKEDQRVHCDREKTSEERYAKLLEDYTKVETENRKLNLRISALDFAKNKAERELQACKKRFEELDLRVLRLEDDTAMLMSGGPTFQKKKGESEAEGPVSDNGRPQYAMGIGTGSANLAHPQVKERTSNCHENVHSSAGAGSAADSMEAGSNRQEAGPNSVIKTCNDRKPIPNQLAVEKGSSNKAMVTSVAGGGRTGSSFVIVINDSDDEMPTKEVSTSKPNIISSGFISTDKEIQSAHSGLIGDENGRSCRQNSPLASSTKRKRGSMTDNFETKNDDDHHNDDMNPTNKRQKKTLQELIMDRIDNFESSDSGDSSSSDSDIESVIAMLRRRKADNKTWAFEVDMILAFKRDIGLCMNAVCALYRQQLCKVKSICESLLSKNRGFDQCDALRGTTLGEYLTDGDPQGKLKRSVSEFQQYDPNGLDDCRKLAIHYSGQLFEIHQKKEDPLFASS